MEDLEEQLRRLSLNDEALIKSVLGAGKNGSASGLDRKTAALARLAALLAMDAETPTYQSAVTDAVGSGATPEEMFAVLITIGPAVGQARVVSAAPRLALAMGHDVQIALEDLATSDSPTTSGSEPRDDQKTTT